MDDNLQNSTEASDQLPTPYPAPAEFDANRIAAAQQVEPLTKDPSALPQFLKRRWGLLSGFLVAGLLSAAIAGMLLGFRGTEGRTTVETPAAPPVINQSSAETPKTPAPVHQPAKAGEIHSRKFGRQLSAVPARVDLPQSTDARAGEKPVARKVGELVLSWEKEERKEKRKAERGRRRGDNDDNH